MRFIFFISFFILLSCHNQKQEKQEKPRSELAILSQAISASPNNPEHFVKRAEYFLDIVLDIQDELEIPSHVIYHIADMHSLHGSEIYYL